MKKLSPLAEEFFDTGRVADCPVYDMHGHMGIWKGIHFPDAATEAMVHSMDRAGVRMLCFCHHAALFCPDIGNAANVEAVRRFPTRLRAYVGINPHYGAAIARDLHCSRATVVTWRGRFAQHRLAGLRDEPRPGRPRSFSPAAAP